MHLFHQRPLCTIGAVLLLLAFVLASLPGVLTLIVGVAAVVLLFLIRRIGFKSMPILILALALCLSLYLSEYHPRAILKNAEADDSFSFTVSEAQDDGEYVGISLRINGIPCPLAKISFTSSETLSVGDRVTVSGVSISPVKAIDAEGIDAYLTSQGQLAIKHRPRSLLALVSSVRGAFSERLRKIGGEEGGPLLSALLLGEESGLALKTVSSFRRLGISHVLAVSGMHLLVISALLSRLLFLLRMPRKARCALVLLLLVLYAVTVGGSPSILRALGMALLAELSFFVGRRTDSLSSLFFSGALLVILSPCMILSLSFQLSFAATFGVVVCARVLKKLTLSERMPSLLYRYLVFPSLMSIFALIFTLPITLYCFGTLSLASLPANLLFAPLYELLLTVGLAALCIGPIEPVSFFVSHLSRALLFLTEKAAEIPYLLLDASHPILLLLFASLAVLLLYFLLGRRSPKKGVYKLALLPIGLLALSLVLFAFPSRESGQISIFGDGKNGEILVLSCGHERAAIDLSEGNGSSLFKMENALSDEAVTELSFYLPAEYGSQTIKAVSRLAKRYLVRLVLLPEPKSVEEMRIRQTLIDYLSRERIPYLLLENDQTLQKEYRITLKRSTDAITNLTVEWKDHLTRYLSGSAAGLLHYTDLPYSDTLILGSRGAISSRLPDTSSQTDHLVLCAEVYPEIFHGKRVSRVNRSLTLNLTD